MKPLEQQIQDAAPRVQPPKFPVDAVPEDASDAIDTLGPGLSPARTPKSNLARRLGHAVMALSVLVAGGVGLSAAIAPALEQPDRNLDGGWLANEHTTPAGTPPKSAVKWRTATLLVPWTDASTGVEATIELPESWSVRRYDPSTEYPGLHATVMDEESLPVATLYFGPTPDPESSVLQPAPEVQLQRIDITTGAELLSPALASAFSYGLTAGPEPRGTFGLVAQPVGVNESRPSVSTAETQPLILRFGDVQRPGSPSAAATASRSTYARTFASAEDARHYERSAEFGTLKRLITSLKFSLPEDRSHLWQLADHRTSAG